MIEPLLLFKGTDHSLILSLVIAKVNKVTPIVVARKISNDLLKSSFVILILSAFRRVSTGHRVGFVLMINFGFRFINMVESITSRRHSFLEA